MATSTDQQSGRAGALAPRLPVPFFDLKAQFDGIREDLLDALAGVAESTQYALGPEVEAFEAAFADFVGARHCVGVNSGTSALHLALICAGVGPGDEVITVPMTFIATTWAISYAGANPVFADVDPVSYTMDPRQVERLITRRTKAILPVHLYGQPADLGPLLEIGSRHGIPVIEDAAQAHGAGYEGRGAGTLGLCGCFSFYPGKNLGALGEAGAVVTDDTRVADRLRALRDHAQSKRYHHDELGFNYRMDAIQGAALAVKLRRLDSWTEARRRLASRYLQALGDLPMQPPAEATGRRHVWHLFVALHPKRDLIRQKLEERGVQTALHYPIPVHLQKAYAHLGHRPGDFPVSEQIGRECLSLPLFPEMTAEQQDAVIAAVREVVPEISRARDTIDE
ncbi:DegT/DnrJ/EryC1/StrS family aminotransferase [Tautonia plasticadhaerens]|uniref:dTDP-3-amino-3,6-dideoxy-alpha-D-galactopyranose transaminase n=1 Tax=Tautonia plasticadhaerens TaxID=2527974 RepID=A0A518HFT2_9BACT|nr:DegT/DnrJ/EryC1/StrS family aminotransferase [Tautonia plasticadhaerens]QDV39701.1 dTDP-3-amino-3,6-dideoxy-alpha-D-galactopyranose transaminase [Tautonia plasticadhaerens]